MQRCLASVCYERGLYHVSKACQRGQCRHSVYLWLAVAYMLDLLSELPGDVLEKT